MSLLAPPLQAFVAIVKHKTVHAAARELHISQTAVTQRLRTLEKRLKTTLFTRTRRGMLITSEGEALLRYCNAARELEGETLAHISGAGLVSDIQVGITGPSSLMRARIIPQCFKIMEQFPHLLMEFIVNDRENRDKELRSGKCQFAAIQVDDVAAEMSHKLLEPEHYVLICSAAWHGRKLADIIKNETIIDFNPEDQIAYNYLKYYDLFDLVRHQRHFVNHTEALAIMLINGFGYGVLTKEFSKRYVDAGELVILNNGRTYENPMALAWYERPEPPAYFSAIVDGIK